MRSRESEELLKRNVRLWARWAGSAEEKEYTRKDGDEEFSLDEL